MTLFAEDEATVTEAAPDQPYERTFYRADYARLAADIQRARHGKHTHQPKSPQQVAVVDQLMSAVIEVLAADSAMAMQLPEKHAFNIDAFVAATQLGGDYKPYPTHDSPHSYGSSLVNADDDEDEDDDED